MPQCCGTPYVIWKHRNTDMKKKVHYACIKAWHFFSIHTNPG